MKYEYKKCHKKTYRSGNLDAIKLVLGFHYISVPSKCGSLGVEAPIFPCYVN
jgi:hypothetical protein